MGRTPEGHVLAEQAMPDVVERERQQRDRRADQDQDAAERRPPLGGESFRDVARLRVGKRQGQSAAREYAEEAEEEEVVGGIVQRSGVAAMVEEKRYDPIHAENLEH